MNILLWILQVLLALHTLVGALWKFSNPASQVDTLSAIPHPVWLTLSGIEILCAVGLLLPAAGRRFAGLAVLSGFLIAVEMLGFCVVLLASGIHDAGSLTYWLVVAVIAGFIAWGRRAGSRQAAR